jgi:hypothetical protein
MIFDSIWCWFLDKDMHGIPLREFGFSNLRISKMSLSKRGPGVVRRKKTRLRGRQRQKKRGKEAEKGGKGSDDSFEPKKDALRPVCLNKSSEK